MKIWENAFKNHFIAPVCCLVFIRKGFSDFPQNMLIEEEDIIFTSSIYGNVQFFLYL